ncbi:MAG: HPF/RaiA family ribosome-associated protein, partial [bacterium]|nr:HPF/RaiA family ribosome-associated protein [bacterium]
MSIKFTSKNVKFTGALKAFTEENLKSIEKISGDIIDAEIIATEEKLDFKAEMSVKTKMHSYHVEDRDPILKQAIRTVLNTLKAQAKKNKEKLTKDKKRNNKETTLKQFAEPEAETGLAPEQPRTDAEKVTVSENFSRKPLSVEEAVFFLKDSEENAYMFPNVET